MADVHRWPDLRFAARLALTGNIRDAGDWLRSRGVPDWTVRTPAPWLVFPALRWLRGFMRARSPGRVFEYGCGGSTLFWLAQGWSCVSVEHDLAWSRRVQALAGNTAALDLRHVAPRPAPEAAPFDPADPARYQSSAPEFAGLSFRDYVRQIDAFPEGHFDLVLVDGRARPSCVEHATAKVRGGGALILDNAERTHYGRVTQTGLAGFRRRSFVGASPCVPVVTRTDVYLREH